MKFSIDNRSSYPATVALAAVKEMLMLPEWPKVQMSRPRAFRHQDTRLPVVAIARFGRANFGLRFVVEDQICEKRKESK